MPEGDAVWRTARRLHDALAGQPLVGVDLRWSRLPAVELHGLRTLEVRPRGKHILHRVESGWTIHSHLRMDGSWRTMPTAKVTPRTARHPDIRAIVATAERAAIGWKLGMLDVVRTRDEPSLVGHLGPDLLGDDWDTGEAARRLRSTGPTPIGAALLDQRNLAGLGTIWTSEPLHECGIDPWRPVEEIDEPTLRGLLEVAHRMLGDSVVHRRHRMQVYGRQGQPCPRCGTPLVRKEIGSAPNDRLVTYCPGCQRN